MLKRLIHRILQFVVSRWRSSPFDEEEKISWRVAIVAIIVGGTALMTLVVVDRAQSGYREKVREHQIERRFQALRENYEYCKHLASELDELDKSLTHAMRSRKAATASLEQALEQCNRAVFGNNRFAGFEELEKSQSAARGLTPAGDTRGKNAQTGSTSSRSGFEPRTLADFLFAGEEPGNAVYRIALGVLYSALVFSIAVLVLSLIESPFVTGKPVTELIETIRKWFGHDDSKGSVASGLASILAPVAIASPILLGTAVALRPDPVELRVNATDAAIDIKPKIVNEKGHEGDPATLRLQVVPEIKPPSTELWKVNVNVDVKPPKEGFPLEIQPFVGKKYQRGISQTRNKGADVPGANNVPAANPPEAKPRSALPADPADSLAVGVSLPDLEQKLEGLLDRLDSQSRATKNALDKFVSTQDALNKNLIRVLEGGVVAGERNSQAEAVPAEKSEKELKDK